MIKQEPRKDSKSRKKSKGGPRMSKKMSREMAGGDKKKARKTRRAYNKDQRHAASAYNDPVGGETYSVAEEAMTKRLRTDVRNISRTQSGFVADVGGNLTDVSDQFDEEGAFIPYSDDEEESNESGTTTDPSPDSDIATDVLGGQLPPGELNAPGGEAEHWSQQSPENVASSAGVSTEPTETAEVPKLTKDWQGKEVPVMSGDLSFGQAYAEARETGGGPGSLFWHNDKIYKATSAEELGTWWDGTPYIPGETRKQTIEKAGETQIEEQKEGDENGVSQDEINLIDQEIAKDPNSAIDTLTNGLIGGDESEFPQPHQPVPEETFMNQIQGSTRGAAWLGRGISAAEEYLPDKVFQGAKSKAGKVAEWFGNKTLSKSQGPSARKFVGKLGSTAAAFGAVFAMADVAGNIKNGDYGAAGLDFAEGVVLFRGQKLPADMQKLYKAAMMKFGKKGAQQIVASNILRLGTGNHLRTGWNNWTQAKGKYRAGQSRSGTYQNRMPATTDAPNRQLAQKTNPNFKRNAPKTKNSKFQKILKVLKKNPAKYAKMLGKRLPWVAASMIPAIGATAVPEPVSSAVGAAVLGVDAIMIYDMADEIYEDFQSDPDFMNDSQEEDYEGTGDTKFNTTPNLAKGGKLKSYEDGGNLQDDPKNRPKTTRDNLIGEGNWLPAVTAHNTDTTQGLENSLYNTMTTNKPNTMSDSKYRMISSNLDVLSDQPDAVAQNESVKEAVGIIQDDPKKYMDRINEVVPEEGITVTNFPDVRRKVKETASDLKVSREDLQGILRDSGMGLIKRKSLGLLMGDLHEEPELAHGGSPANTETPTYTRDTLPVFGEWKKQYPTVDETELKKQYIKFYDKSLGENKVVDTSSMPAMRAKGGKMNQLRHNNGNDATYAYGGKIKKKKKSLYKNLMQQENENNNNSGE